MFDTIGIDLSTYTLGNNADEIIFFIQGKALGGTMLQMNLVKLNLSTNVLSTLLTTNFASRPSWSKTGWIVFGLRDEQIWKIKDNGDSLTQVTSTAPNYNPFFTNDTDVFICDNSANGANTALLMSLNGEILDTLYDYPDQRTPACNSKNTLLGATNFSMVTYKLGDNVSVVVPDDNFDAPHFNGVVWLTDSTCIWADNAGIYTTSIITSDKKQVLETCDSRLYFSPIYARSINKVIWTKLIYDQVEGKNILHFTSRLVMMNPDGTDEEVIDIPR